MGIVDCQSYLLCDKIRPRKVVLLLSDLIAVPKPIPYMIELQCSPLYECLNSLHTYICRPSYKKIDLEPAWAKSLEEQLPAEFAERLAQTGIDAEWRLIVLLVCCCPEETPEQFVQWIEKMSPEQLERLIAEHTSLPTISIARLRSRILILFQQWNQYYFSQIDPQIIHELQKESQHKQDRIKQSDDLSSFVDEVTNGIVFEPQAECKRLILVPHYHFQPLNIIYAYHSFMICHYPAKLYLGDSSELPPYQYRVIRALAEQSRLKILKYLHAGPRSFIEIVRHLGLSKGITHDHVTKLRSAGLLHAHIQGETLTAYSLRTQAIHDLPDMLMNFVEQNDSN